MACHHREHFLSVRALCPGPHSLTLPILKAPSWSEGSLQPKFVHEDTETRRCYTACLRAKPGIQPRRLAGGPTPWPALRLGSQTPPPVSPESKPSPDTGTWEADPALRGRALILGLRRDHLQRGARAPLSHPLKVATGLRVGASAHSFPSCLIVNIYTHIFKSHSVL